MVTVLELCGGRERGGGRVQSSAASAETERQGEEHEEPRTGRGPHALCGTSANALWDVCCEALWVSGLRRARWGARCLAAFSFVCA
jgi:hypothetical protein